MVVRAKPDVDPGLSYFFSSLLKAWLAALDDFRPWLIREAA
jgi:hypothetical protein